MRHADLSPTDSKLAAWAPFSSVRWARFALLITLTAWWIFHVVAFAIGTNGVNNPFGAVVVTLDVPDSGADNGAFAVYLILAFSLPIALIGDFLCHIRPIPRIVTIASAIRYADIALASAGIYYAGLGLNQGLLRYFGPNFELITVPLISGSSARNGARRWRTGARIALFHPTASSHLCLPCAPSCD